MNLSERWIYLRTQQRLLAVDSTAYYPVAAISVSPEEDWEEDVFDDEFEDDSEEAFDDDWSDKDGDDDWEDDDSWSLLADA